VPGLVNAHMHETLDRGVFEDVAFERWLYDFAFPKDRAYQARHQRAAALLNQLEMIRGGTTTFIDIFRHPGVSAEIALQSGLRATFSPQVIESPDGVGESFEANLAFVESWRDRQPDRIRAWFGPHSLYSCSPATYRAMAEAARRLGVGIHTHLAESRYEVETITRRQRVSPAVLLDRLVGEVPHLVAAHAVHMSDDDLALASARKWSVAHCPSSNMKLGNGTARVPDMMAAGITVGLGTDSNMTNNNLDMWEEMRQAALVQKLEHRDPAVLPARQALAMATRGSATALGWGDEIGAVEVGRLADLAVVDLAHCHLWPAFASNLEAQLVYSASAADVRTTIVAGNVLMEDYAVLSVDPAMVEEVVHREARHLLEKAGVFGG
ncbi:MAG TPA: amidohydrolase, partial [Acidimicrobiales bacterium]|nr:amidohydrolase [Acidimicrobiales bacterium]